jgi:hypothetical protein
VLTPQFSVARNGSLAPDWKPERIDVIDPLGNVANEIENQLSVRESAWKAVITLARDTPAAFAPDEQWTSPLLAIPVGDVSQTPDLRATVQSVALTVVGFGRGKFAYRENVSADEAARQDWHDVPRSELAASPSRGNILLFPLGSARRTTVRSSGIAIFWAIWRTSTSSSPMHREIIENWFKFATTRDDCSPSNREPGRHPMRAGHCCLSPFRPTPERCN